LCRSETSKAPSGRSSACRPGVRRFIANRPRLHCSCDGPAPLNQEKETKCVSGPANPTPSERLGTARG
jgi:hypothetical protein